MSIDVSGGAGGVTARYQDLRSEARVLDDAGDDVRRRADDAAKVAVDEAVLAAAVLCPVEAATVGTAAAAAALTLGGVSASLEGTALVLRATVETYELLDDAQRAVLDGLHVAGGWALGAALPGLVVVGGAVLLTNPALTLLLGVRVARDPDAVVDGALDTLFANPWLMEELAATAPWVVQGSATTLSGGLAVPFLLSGGSWPTPDYGQAVGGLVAAGTLFGAFRDQGEFEVVPVAGHDGAPPRSVEDVFEQQAAIGDDDGQVQITRVVGPDGQASWVVQVPGTQDWSPTRTDNPVDLTTNVTLMSGRQTLLQDQVAAAMRAAGIGPGDPVMLTGHSQGGIACAAMASDPAFREEFAVRSVVTGGSPIARFDIPDDVSVLSLEHDQDPVPMLEGRENPDRPRWVTIERDLSGTRVTDPGAAHGTDVYAETGALVDASDDPSVAAWREASAGFFEGEPETTRYQIRPVAP